MYREARLKCMDWTRCKHGGKAWIGRHPSLTITSIFSMLVNLCAISSSTYTKSSKWAIHPVSMKASHSWWYVSSLVQCSNPCQCLIRTGNFVNRASLHSCCFRQYNPVPNIVGLPPLVSVLIVLWISSIFATGTITGKLFDVPYRVILQKIGGTRHTTKRSLNCHNNDHQSNGDWSKHSSLKASQSFSFESKSKYSDQPTPIRIGKFCSPLHFCHTPPDSKKCKSGK